MGQFSYFTVDVFTSERFGGNQLAVFPDAREIPESSLQKIAREFNFSETTFVYPPDNKENDCKVRIFTPGIEVPMAGHPTIGAVYVLLNMGFIKPKNNNYLILEEKVGDIRVDFMKGNTGFHSITMSQPLPKFGPIEKNLGLIAGLLSIRIEDINQNIPVQSVSCGNNFLFIPLLHLTVMHQISVKNDLLKSVKSQIDSTELFVFTPETIYPDSDFHCRMFAPLFGVTEDPATGSAAGPFGCYLVKNNISAKKEFVIEQGFEMMRPSFLKVKIEESNDQISGVKVRGDAVFVCEGKMRI